MIFDTYYSEREIARLMSRIPNFRPRGHGNYVFGRFEYSAEDCDCNLCLHYQKKIGCTKQLCPYMMERITAGAVPITKVLLETFSEIDHFDFQIRLLQYIYESEENTMQFKNDKHRETFTEAVKRLNKKDKSLMAAIYLLTADGRLWGQAKRYIDHGGVHLDLIRLRDCTETAYTLLCCAKDLTLGTKYIAISDLADTGIISPKIFGVICNAIAIRRYGLGAIQFDE